ncbi:hypothetical protein AAVH_20705 [Aphelenchoides avenae]|nr:hypothetical protein AAVH_20705 [Aphelenchus avenae]
MESTRSNLPITLEITKKICQRLPKQELCVPASKRRRLTRRNKRRTLPSDILLDVFACEDRDSLDTLLIVCRRYNAIIAAVTNISIRRIVRASLMRTNNCVLPIGKFRRTASSIRVSSESEKEIVEVFFNGLRSSSISMMLEIGGITIDRHFMRLLHDVSDSFTFEGLKSELSLTELCTDGIPPTRFLDAFPSPRRLGSYDNLSFFPEEAVNDDLLRCLARNGIWRNDLINEYRLNYITEDGIIDYCFGDYPPNIGKRELSVYGPSHSERLLEKLVQSSSNGVTMTGRME